MSKTDSYVHISPNSIEDLREWLESNHDSQPGAWILFWKKNSNKPYIPYGDFVDELLCYGWIDSTIRPIDDHSYKQIISPRKSNSVWSKVNKDKIERLLSEGRVKSMGLRAISVAKENGSWTVLDEAERLELPVDLQNKLLTISDGFKRFESLSPSRRKYYLSHLVMAKREATRVKRIEAILVDLSNIVIKTQG
ncbi:MAG: YdeI/OmpD-associated family protein [Bacteroidales bacterium]